MSGQMEPTPVTSLDGLPDEKPRPFLTIVVLMCGVFGGLVAVISFILFCKYCIKKKEPQQGTPTTIKAKLRAKTKYESLANNNSMASTVTSPMPLDCEAFWQQPPDLNHKGYNVEAKNGHAEMLVNEVGGSKQKLSISQNEEHIVIETIDTSSSPKLNDTSPSGSGLLSVGDTQKLRPERMDSLFPRVNVSSSSRRASDVPPSRRTSKSTLSAADSTGGDSVFSGDRCTVLGSSQTQLTVPQTQRERSRSFPKEQESPSDRRSNLKNQDHYPRSNSSNSHYYAEEYDRKYQQQQSSGSVQRIQRDLVQQSLTLPGTGVASTWRRQSSASAYGDVDRPARVLPPSPNPKSPRELKAQGSSSHVIVDKVPPSTRKQISFNFDPSAADHYRLEVNNNSRKVYDREHVYSKSYTLSDHHHQEQLQDMANGCQKPRSLYGKDHANAHTEPPSYRQSYGKGQYSPPKRILVRQQPVLKTSPDRPPSELEFQQLQNFYRECEKVFPANQIQAPAGQHKQQGSGSCQQKPLLQQPPPGFQGEINGGYDGNERGEPRFRFQHSPSRHAAQSFDSSVSNDDDHLRRPPDTRRLSQSFDSGSEVAAHTHTIDIRQLADDAIMNQLRIHAIERERELRLGLGDKSAEVEKEVIKQECRTLWELRSTIEKSTDLCARSPSPEDNRNFPEIEEQYATTSGTTSFESNTEPLAMEEPQPPTGRKPSGAFLEPPAAYEARKQKYRNLLASRQIELQQQRGYSMENSFESFDTVDSTGTESSRPEFFVASFESNVSNVSGISNVSNVSNVSASQNGEQTDDSSGRKKIAELKNDSGYKSESLHDHAQQNQDQQLVYDTIVQRSRFDGGGAAQYSFDGSTGGGAHDYPSDRGTYCHVSDVTRFIQSLRRQDTADTNKSDTSLFLYNNYDFDSDSLRSDFISGESFDGDGVGNGSSFVDAPALQLQQHRASLPLAIVRDFSVDSKTDAIFRDFVRYDPTMERRSPRSNRGRAGLGRYGRNRYSIEFDAPISPLRHRLSPGDSIEEEATGPYSSSPEPGNNYGPSGFVDRHYDPRQSSNVNSGGYHGNNISSCRPSIPVIKLPSDEEISVRD